MDYFKRNAIISGLIYQKYRHSIPAMPAFLLSVCLFQMYSGSTKWEEINEKAYRKA